MRKRNPLARVVKLRQFRLKIVKPKKGKGSYTRKGKSLPFSMALILLNKNIDSRGPEQRRTCHSTFRCLRIAFI